MENKEWLDDYLSLKQVNPNNPFTVPAGYFDGLSERVMSGVKFDELKTSTPLSKCLTVPENYFNELNDKIKSRITVESVLNIEDKNFTIPSNYFEELNNNIQSRIAIEGALNAEANNFAVPENYFEDLNNKIQSRIAVEALINKENTGFAVPESYFDNLNTQINSRVFVEEALKSTTESFTVPENYFDTLNEIILNNTVKQQTVKRKGAIIRVMTSGAFKYATAACFALIIGVAVFLKQAAEPTPAHNATYLHKELANVPADEIQSYIQLNVDANDAQHTVATEDLKLDDKDLNAALQDYSDNN